jgi:hypothetical protein
MVSCPSAYIECKCGGPGKYCCHVCRMERLCKVNSCSVEGYRQHRAAHCQPKARSCKGVEGKNTPNNYLLEDEDELILRSTDPARLREV